jgi:hypothetical protein
MIRINEEAKNYFSRGIGGAAATIRICINDTYVNIDRRCPHLTTTALAKAISVRTDEQKQ